MGAIPDELHVLIRDIYNPAGLVVTSDPTTEAESADYGACRFALDGKSLAFRVAKTTPTKLGQFVTVWKRPNPDGPIAPFDANDDVDGVIVVVVDGTSSDVGQFVFGREVLVANGVLSEQGRGGKRALRVYAPWVQPVVKSAIKAQQWQAPHFVNSALSRNAEGSHLDRVRERGRRVIRLLS